LSHRYCGRPFSAEDLARIRRLIAEAPGRSRAELSRLTCQMLGWYKPDGGLKDMSARVAMLRMHREGLIELPPPRRSRPQVTVASTSQTDPSPAIVSPARALTPLRLQAVQNRHDSRLWNEYIHRYHYLGYQPLPGAQRRYLIFSDQQPIALLGFGAAAWQVAPRDRYIGWSHEQRQRHLPLIVNNARFLILPWVRVSSLASKLLAMAARSLPAHWEGRYGYRPVLLETFVEAERFAGTCYRAANWTCVGQTQGRGKLGDHRLGQVPVKTVWVYPLAKDFRVRLWQ
jgi:hypothetical protein